jgi:hypothetical protein
MDIELEDLKLPCLPIHLKGGEYDVLLSHFLMDVHMRLEDGWEIGLHHSEDEYSHHETSGKAVHLHCCGDGVHLCDFLVLGSLSIVVSLHRNEGLHE